MTKAETESYLHLQKVACTFSWALCAQLDLKDKNKHNTAPSVAQICTTICKQPVEARANLSRRGATSVNPENKLAYGEDMKNGHMPWTPTCWAFYFILFYFIKCTQNKLS